MNTFPYIYSNGEYDNVSLHRRVISFDPRNTDNILVLDYLNARQQRKDHGMLFNLLMRNELGRHKNAVCPTLPISFKMIYHQMNIAWVDLIHQMVFIDGAYNTFYAEYKEIIDNILAYDTIDAKESLVYRYYNSGESIFHIAAKTWIVDSFDRKRHILVTERIKSLSADLKYVLECYHNLERVMNKQFALTYMTDFSDITLVDYLTYFIKELEDNHL